jgi:hypothetical protein
MVFEYFFPLSGVTVKTDITVVCTHGDRKYLYLVASGTPPSTPFRFRP